MLNCLQAILKIYRVKKYRSKFTDAFKFTQHYPNVDKWLLQPMVAIPVTVEKEKQLQNIAATVHIQHL